MLGLKRTDNYLVEYCDEWPRIFLKESARISKVLNGLPHQIEHYGSTSVPGMPAKPILDLLLGIPDLDIFDEYRVRLESLCYDYAANAGVTDHYIFGRGKHPDERSHLLHIVVLDGNAWNEALAFRDRLRQDEELRKLYLDAKEKSCKRAPRGRVQYNELKQKLFFSKL